MARGDQIFVMRPFVGLDGVYEHHGIDCGDGTVIHYRKGETAQISRTSIESFAMGKPIFFKPQSVSYVPDIVIQRAESRLGEQQYSLLTNNCEHFANWCKTGRNDSEQLFRFGIDTTRLSTATAEQLMEEAVSGGDPGKALMLADQAMRNMAIAQQHLQTEYNRTQKEVDTWHRAAELALKQGKEYLARAALERKVSYKRKADDFKAQLDQLVTLQQDLDRNSAMLRGKVQLV